VVFLLVSLSPAPAQAQPLGQAKVAIISASFFFLPPTKNLIKGGFLGKLLKTKVRKGTKLGRQKKIQQIPACVRANEPENVHARFVSN
jgi:hypothetical protein